MLAGAWGARAGELLERGAERRTKVHRVGRLTMPRPPDLAVGSWCCWLFGAPEDRGALTTRFGLPPRGDLLAAFGRALTELGEGACELLHGRFVVVALDRERDRCLVTRDQLGAAPLVYTRVADGVLFAEHERDLIDLLPRTPAPDRLALAQWIENGVIPVGHTLYEDIRRLPAGHQMILAERMSVERWWHLRFQESEQGSAADLAERLRDAAFAAVGRAAAGAKRPAVKLSGGLDSACVAAGLATNGFADGRALAIGGTFPNDPSADESELIEATARHTRLPLEVIQFDPKGSLFAPGLEHIVRWRLPPATPNLYLWQPLMARARELGADLMLDGEGGDELFGVAPYLIADMLRGGRLRSAWSLTDRIPGTGKDPNARLRLRVLRRFGLSPLVPDAVRRRREASARRAARGSILALADARALAELREQARRDRRDGPLWWRLQVESLIEEREDLGVGEHLRRYSIDERIERRHPFLYDLTLTEAALRIPPGAQFDPVRDRPVLRDGLNGLIPEAVRTRYVKSHLSYPLLAALGANESELIDPLRRSDAPVRAYVAPRELHRRLEMPVRERSLLDAGHLWQIAIANRWLLSQAGENS
jgi:asparagine synthase (glutamine-hydrolysing)